MNAIEAYKKHIAQHPNGPGRGIEEWLSLSKAAIAEDRIAFRKVLWEQMRSGGPWAYWGLSGLTAREFRDMITDEEYEELGTMLDHPEERWRNELGTLLGESFRWPHPHLMYLVTHDHSPIRAAKLSYLFGAAGLTVQQAFHYGDVLAAKDGLITEAEIMDVIERVKSKKPAETAEV